MEILFTPNQFRYAIKGLNMSDENVAIMKEHFCKGTGLRDLSNKHGKTYQAIYKQLLRVNENLKERLDEDGKKIVAVIIDKEPKTK